MACASGVGAVAGSTSAAGPREPGIGGRPWCHTEGVEDSYPELVATVLDAVDARALAEFYRRLLGYHYRPGDEEVVEDEEVVAEVTDPAWLVLLDRAGRPRLAVQRVPELPRVTWPGAEVAQQLHLDLTVASVDELRRHHDRTLALGATVLQDRSMDPDEPLIVYADPAGHPFCLLVG